MTITEIARRVKERRDYVHVRLISGGGWNRSASSGRRVRRPGDGISR